MMLLTQELAVVVEVLDNEDCPLADFPATLRHLEGDFALLTCSCGAGGKNVYWGARVRFTLAECDEAYTLNGSIVQLTVPPDSSPHTESAATTDVAVKLTECLPACQRRRFERRSNRVAIEYRPDAAFAPSDDAEIPWQQGHALDLSAGGMRFRSKEALCVGQRMTLRLRAEAFASQDGSLSLRARILRVTPAKSSSNAFDIAVKFEALPVAAGLHLAHLLS